MIQNSDLETRLPAEDTTLKLHSSERQLSESRHGSSVLRTAGPLPLPLTSGTCRTSQKHQILPASHCPPVPPCSKTASRKATSAFQALSFHQAQRWPCHADSSRENQLNHAAVTAPIMPTTRLTFLYPALFRTAGACARNGAPRAFQQASKHRTSTGPALRMASTFSTSTASRNAAFPRHGTAVEPVDTTSPSGGEAQPVPSPTTETRAKVKPESAPAAVPTNDKTNTKDEPQDVAKEPVAVKTSAEEKPGPGPGPGPGTLNAAAAAGAAAGKTPQQAAADAKMKQGGPMEAVLHMPPPDMVSHPHITPSPYVHHFDTYTLVKQLETDGYTKEQATTAMKAIRLLLAHHLEVAQGGLVSKSDVDNVRPRPPNNEQNVQHS